MDKVKDELKAQLTKVLSFFDNLEDKYKKILVSILSVCALLLLFLSIVPTFQASIRQKQVDNFLTDKITDDKHFIAVAPDELIKVIKENKQVNVLLIDPTAPQMEAITNLVHHNNDKESMKQTVYVYPMIYNVKETKKFFNLSKGTTLFHFKNAVESYRVNFKSSEEIEFHFFDYLEDISNHNKKKKR
ncbi:hypothetical protein [Vagococcus xieshaowenii]|uniref:Uncharacterized protein n=1 Tax=Vagococcus xieshaowenii TaxID=2562451 RepID=A0AAJ5JLI7_9ENTE|nr:hypothetical protein [Vagococcus xieshaowenii]QCA28410.1 hypothetical protein E4Z98_03450 [Vagococcus xieshaowenii]TFZ42834.1 hypothetical protein E4031_02290 [Vagococcus xieshaowenii]